MVLFQKHTLKIQQMKKEFLEYLRNIEDRGNFYKVKLKDMTYYHDEFKNLRFDEVDASMDDFAFATFLERAELRCGKFLDPYFRDKNTALVDSIIEEALKSNETASKIYILDCEVRACHSENYAILPITELVDTLKTYLANKCDDVKFAGGFYTDQITCVYYSIKDKNIVEPYQRLLNKRTDNAEIVIRFTTSNLGLCGANLTALFCYNGRNIPICDNAFSLEHKGEASIKKFADNCNKLFGVVNAAPERIQALDNIIIDYPTACAINLCEKAGVPQNKCMEIIENISIMLADSIVTAKTLYLYLTGIISKADDNNEMMLLTEKVGKMIRMLEHKSSVDIPTVKWKRLKISVDEGQGFIPGCFDDREAS